MIDKHYMFGKQRELKIPNKNHGILIAIPRSMLQDLQFFVKIKHFQILIDAKYYMTKVPVENLVIRSLSKMLGLSSLEDSW